MAIHYPIFIIDPWCFLICTSWHVLLVCVAFLKIGQAFTESTIKYNVFMWIWLTSFGLFSFFILFFTYGSRSFHRPTPASHNLQFLFLWRWLWCLEPRWEVTRTRCVGAAVDYFACSATFVSRSVNWHNPDTFCPFVLGENGCYTKQLWAIVKYSSPNYTVWMKHQCDPLSDFWFWRRICLKLALFWLPDYSHKKHTLHKLVTQSLWNLIKCMFPCYSRSE